MFSKEKYEQPMILLISFSDADIITASLTQEDSVAQGDNVIEDSFFD